MATIEIKVTDAKYRTWEYFLRRKYKTKASLERIAKDILLREVAQAAADELKEAEGKP